MFRTHFEHFVGVNVNSPIANNLHLELLQDEYSASAKALGFDSQSRPGILSSILLVLSDLAVFATAFFLGGIIFTLYHFNEGEAEVISSGFDNLGEIQLLLFSGVSLLAVFLFWKDGHYSKRRPFWDELRQILRITLFIALLDSALLFLGKWPFSRLWLATVWLSTLFLLPVGRLIIRALLNWFGIWQFQTVIIGDGENAHEAARALIDNKALGYNVLAFLAPNTKPDIVSSIQIRGRTFPVLPCPDDPRSILTILGNPHVVMALEQEDTSLQNFILTRLGPTYPSLHIAPPVNGFPLHGLEAEHFFNHDMLFLKIRNNLGRFWARGAKRIFDIIGSFILLFLCSPIFLFVTYMIRREDGHQSIYSQERIGKNGELFRMYKFRSMHIDAEEILKNWQKENNEIYEIYKNNNFKLKNDPRITKIGQWIRKTSIDELPQLWNVLIGNMSLVGPRPLLPREISDYGEEITLYNQVRPGITGIWQISGRSKTCFTDRASMDAWHIRNWSLWGDIYILLRTIKVVFRQEGAY